MPQVFEQSLFLFQKQELHQLEPKNWCQLFSVWATLFFTSLTPNIALAFGDIFSDAYLVIEYHGDMTNATHVQMQREECARLEEERPIPLQVILYRRGRMNVHTF